MDYRYSTKNQGKYQHLSYKECAITPTMLRLGKTKSKTAREFNRSKPTITNKINRKVTIQIKQNKGKQIYLADTRQVVYEAIG